jgi:asparagine synthase (glutamine-hydrolysing)
VCGIALALRLDGGPAPVEVVARMVAALAHRGPDGEGVTALGPLALGHRRLSILDLSERAAQPMTRGPLTVIHNGELYDYRERRDELRGHGARFTTDGDTEVLLEAYARWGTGCFERLRGMWAVALWDASNRRLVLSRDRFGIKPMYLLERAGVLYAASEVKALLAAVPDAREVDPVALGRFLLHGMQDEDERTFLKDVRQLPAATTLVIEGGRRTTTTYWSPARALERPIGDATAALRAVLEESVALHLRSDVPVGSCLSGGLDSSAIVGLAAKGTPHPVRTFTAVYDDEGHDERRYAREVVARFGCEATEVHPAPGRDLVSLLDRIGWFHDEPCGRPGLITQWYVMQSAQGRVKVLLDGQGGDELLCGYTSHALPYLRSLARAARRRPGALGLKLARDAAGLLRGRSTTNERPGTLARHLVSAALRRARGRARATLAPELATALLTDRDLRPRNAGQSPIDALLVDDLTRRSIPALLHHEDRASMAFGIEARVPFLDHRVVETCLAMAFTEKVDGPYTKAVLRRALADLLPASVLERTDKLGYQTPTGRWLRESGAEVKELLLDGFAERGHVPALDVTRGWLEVEAGGGDAVLVYRWLTTELWLRRFVDRPAEAPAV